jgi:hypothetical protein
VSALGHFLEREGIPTVSISLVREHTEAVRPPRALWVTFELGRPFGIPDDPPFQRRVVKAALELLERTDGPLIADYPEHVTEPVDYTGWACPVNLAPQQAETLASEVERLAPWYDRSVADRARTTVGLSGLDIPSAARLVSDALAGELPEALLLKRAVEDLKAYYLEAASAFPEAGTPATRKEWLWGETILARALMDLLPKLAASDDKLHQFLASYDLIPAAERHRLG